MKKLLAVLVVLAAVGGGYWYWQSQQQAPGTAPQEATAPTGEQPAAPTAQPEPAAASQPAAGMTKLRIATEGAYPPFNFVDSDGKLGGFDVDIANALCAKMQMECEIVVQDWDGIIPGLEAKKYDAIVASMSITDERKQKVDFSDKYYNTPTRFVHKKGSGIELTPEGLKGKRVGVQRSTIWERFLQAQYPEAEIVLYGAQEEANTDMAAGRLDLLLSDAIVLQDSFLAKPEGADFEFLGEGFFEPRDILGNGVGVAVRKGETELLQKFNQAIADIQADGTYKSINDKYFPFDIYGK